MEDTIVKLVETLGLPIALIIIVVLAMWKGIPKVVSFIETRFNKYDERLEKLTDRFDKQDEKIDKLEEVINNNTNAFNLLKEVILKEK